MIETDIFYWERFVNGRYIIAFKFFTFRVNPVLRKNEVTDILFKVYETISTDIKSARSSVFNHLSEAGSMKNKNIIETDYKTPGLDWSEEAENLLNMLMPLPSVYEIN